MVSSADVATEHAPRDPGFSADGLRAEVFATVRPNAWQLVSGPGATSGSQTAAYATFYNCGLADSGHDVAVLQSGAETIVVQRFTPPADVPVQGTTVVLHGYYDHVGIYQHLVRYCLARGQVVLMPDMPGHGLSTGARATIPTFDDYVAAAQTSLDFAASELPRPWRLVGQSMGGSIAMLWLIRRGFTRANSPFAGIGLLAPMVRPHQWPLNRIVFMVLKSWIEARPRTFSENSKDLEFVRFLREDDILQPRTLPVAWVAAMVEWMSAFALAPSSDLAPVVIQGDDDLTVDWRYNVPAIVEKFDAVVRYVPGARHHMVNEDAATRAEIFKHLDIIFD